MSIEDGFFASWIGSEEALTKLLHFPFSEKTHDARPRFLQKLMRKVDFSCRLLGKSFETKDLTKLWRRFMKIQLGLRIAVVILTLAAVASFNVPLPTLPPPVPQATQLG